MRIQWIIFLFFNASTIPNVGSFLSFFFDFCVISPFQDLASTYGMDPSWEDPDASKAKKKRPSKAKEVCIRCRAYVSHTYDRTVLEYLSLEETCQTLVEHLLSRTVFRNVVRCSIQFRITFPNVIRTQNIVEHGQFSNKFLEHAERVLFCRTCDISLVIFLMIRVSYGLCACCAAVSPFHLYAFFFPVFFQSKAPENAGLAEMFKELAGIYFKEKEKAGMVYAKVCKMWWICIYRQWRLWVDGSMKTYCTVVRFDFDGRRNGTSFIWCACNGTCFDLAIVTRRGLRAMITQYV